MFNRKGSFSYYYEDTEGLNHTGIPGELKFQGSYNFSPGEKEVRYYKDGSGHPGCPPEFELYNFDCTHIDGMETHPLDGKSLGLWLECKFEDEVLRDGLIQHILEELEDERQSYEENKLDYLREQSTI